MPPRVPLLLALYGCTVITACETDPIPADTRPPTCSSTNVLVNDDISCGDSLCRIEPGFYTGAITFSAANQYRLEGAVMMGDVSGDCPAELVIEAGTVILAAADANSQLVILPSGSIVADGAATTTTPAIQPIVFRSEAEPPQAGTWLGIDIRGRAETNCGGTTGVCEHGAPQDQFGGRNNRSNSGTLRYVRIEDAGADGHPALSLKAQGQGTTIEHIHIHESKGDGLLISGGRVQLRHILLTQIQGHSFQWTYGWQGLAQFVVIQQPTDTTGSALRGSNSFINPDATPRSSPILSHFTIVGPSASPTNTNPPPGIQFAEGTGGELWNSVITSYPPNHPAIDIDGSATFTHALSGEDHLSIDHSVFCNPTNAIDDPEDPFSSKDLLRGESTVTPSTNSVSATCQLGLPEGISDPDIPDFTPISTSSLAQGAGDPLNVFFGNTTYRGAVAPGQSPAWYQWVYP